MWSCCALPWLLRLAVSKMCLRATALQLPWCLTLAVDVSVHFQHALVLLPAMYCADRTASPLHEWRVGGQRGSWHMGA
jgi:hypothetical protein